MGLMKTIDIKSLIIGALLTSTIFLGVASTSPTDKWDKEQKWEVYDYLAKDLDGDTDSEAVDKGEEPFAVTLRPNGMPVIWARTRAK